MAMEPLNDISIRAVSEQEIDLVLQFISRTG